MEKALLSELTKEIPELNDQIYPTNAPETAEKPYMVYARITTKKTKVLSGYTDGQAITYMYSIMATRYADMYSLRGKVEKFLLSLPQTKIGEDHIHVKDITINNIDETWEPELKVRRGIIDFTIYF